MLHADEHTGFFFYLIMKYKNLFFDLDDTLWAFSLNARNTFEEIYHKYQFNRYFDSFHHFYSIYQDINVKLWAEYGDGKITKQQLNNERFYYPLKSKSAIERDASNVATSGVHVKCRAWQTLSMGLNWLSVAINL